MSIICFTCNLQIQEEKYVVADNRQFHVEHFVCSICQIKLTGPIYRRRESCIYCDQCFESQFAPKCLACQNKILGKHIVVEQDDHYHNGCFACTYCTKQFENGEYYKQDEQPFCKACLARKMNVTCFKCNELCEGNEIFANNQYFHSECFTCAKCDQPIEQLFIVIEENCYHDECVLKLCTVCEQEIEEDYYEVENENVVHPHCLDEYDPAIHVASKIKQPRQIDNKQQEESKSIIQLKIQVECQDEEKGKKYSLKQIQKQDLNQLDPSFFNQERPRYNYEVLRKIPPPEGVMQNRKELYLSDEEFEKLFKMKLKRFMALTEQKRLSFKKQLGL